MKKSEIICILMVLVVAFGSTEKAAGVNPAEWDFSLETYGGNASWTSLTNVDTGYPQYEYVWQLNYADAQIAGGWYSVMDYIPSGDKSGSGTEAGLPFVVFDDDVEQAGIFSAHVLAGVNSTGYGYADMTNIVFGSFGGYGLTGFRCGGHATVTGVPEPATLVLLGTVGIWIFTRKKQQFLGGCRSK